MKKNLLLALFLLPSLAIADVLSGCVVKVVHGDKIDVLSDRTKLESDCWD